MGQFQQGSGPSLTAPVGLLEQILQGVADVEGLVGGGGLGGAEGLEPIQQTVLIHRQRRGPGGEAGIGEQGEHEVLHIHGAVPPAASHVLTGDQQIPGRSAEALGIGGEAGRRWRCGGGGHRQRDGGAGTGQGAAAATGMAAGAASWISSTL